ncbi:hypothetical protein MIDIC_460027 [Alphaproteobacteria bacterium]
MIVQIVHNIFLQHSMGACVHEKSKNVQKKKLGKMIKKKQYNVATLLLFLKSFVSRLFNTASAINEVGSYTKKGQFRLSFRNAGKMKHKIIRVIPLSNKNF